MNEQDVERRLDQLGKSAPRITPAIVDAAIVGKQVSVLPNTRITACVLTLYNGFTVVGLNKGPVAAENFDPAIGESLAFAAAREQVWPVLGAILAEQLYRQVAHPPAGAAPLPDTRDPGHFKPAEDAALAGRLALAENALSLQGYAFDATLGDYTRYLHGVEPEPAGGPPTSPGVDSPVDESTPQSDTSGELVSPEAAAP